eukprot:s1_g2082.t1
MGDGILAYFGFPEAAENAASKAVVSALRIREAVAGLAPIGSSALQVRSGIATGPVIVGEQIGTGIAQEISVVGDTPNLASRLQTTAAPNTILVSQKTRELADTLIRFDDRGRTNLKGFTGTHHVFEAVAMRQPSPSFGAPRSPLPLLGRTEEVETLAAAGQQAFGKGGRVIGIVGEAGIGKSHLLSSLEALQTDALSPPPWLTAYAHSLFTRVPFFTANQVAPVSNTALNTEPHSNTDMSKSQDHHPAEAADSASHESMSLAELHARAMVSAISQNYAGQRVVFAFEDLHWADPATGMFLQHLAARAAGEPWLILYTSRTSQASRWGAALSYRELSLTPLDATANLDLVSRLAQNHLSSETVKTIITRSGGNPLFLKELTSWALSNKAESHLTIPDSLADLLLSRLDKTRVPLAVLQAAAILGNECTKPLLADLTGLAPATIDAAVGDLLAGGILKAEIAEVAEVAEVAEAGRFIFAHQLLSDAVYETLLRNQRQSLHQAAATALTQAPPTSSAPQVIAHHWLGAEQPDMAVDLLVSAGERARLKGDHIAAQALLESASDALPLLKNTPARDRIELTLQTALSKTLQITIGYSAPVTLAAALKAEKLAERLGDFKQQYDHVASQWMAASSAGRLQEAAKLSQRVLSLALSHGEPTALAFGWMARLTALCRIGNIQGAETAFQNGKPHFAAPEFLQIPGSLAQTHGNAAIIALLGGNIAEARHRAAIALNRGRAAATPYDQAFSRYMVAMFAMMQGADRSALRLAASAVEISRTHKFPQFEATSQIVLGRALASLEDPDTGAHTIRSGLKLMEKAASQVGQTMYLTWLAEAENFSGRADKALATLEDALTLNPEERFYRVETLRLSATLLAQAGQEGLASKRREEATALAKDLGTQWHLARLS